MCHTKSTAIKISTLTKYQILHFHHSCSNLSHTPVFCIKVLEYPQTKCILTINLKSTTKLIKLLVTVCVSISM